MVMTRMHIAAVAMTIWPCDSPVATCLAVLRAMLRSSCDYKTKSTSQPTHTESTGPEGTHMQEPQPMSKQATTRSPTWNFVTSGPTDSTMPMNCNGKLKVENYLLNSSFSSAACRRVSGSACLRPRCGEVQAEVKG